MRRIVYLGGFVPEDDDLSEHLTSRAEVADALTIDGGPEVVWLGAAMIIGAGSTSFEMLRYVGDRFAGDSVDGVDEQPDGPDLHPRRSHYLSPRPTRDRVPAGAYDISGPETTTYRDLLAAYGRAISGTRQAECTDPWSGYRLGIDADRRRAAGARWTRGRSR